MGTGIAVSNITALRPWTFASHSAGTAHQTRGVLKKQRSMDYGEADLTSLALRTILLSVAPQSPDWKHIPECCVCDANGPVKHATDILLRPISRRALTSHEQAHSSGNCLTVLAASSHQSQQRPRRLDDTAASFTPVLLWRLSVSSVVTTCEVFTPAAISVLLLEQKLHAPVYRWRISQLCARS